MFITRVVVSAPKVNNMSFKVQEPHKPRMSCGVEPCIQKLKYFEIVQLNLKSEITVDSFIYIKFVFV